MEVRAISEARPHVSDGRCAWWGTPSRGCGLGRRWPPSSLIPNKAGDIIAKTVKSAVANAENNYNLAAEDLYVVQVVADEGRSLKRWRARARGRAAPIIKRSSHITVVVEEREA